MPRSRSAVVALWLALLPPCFGREIVYLTSGFSFEATAHTKAESSLLLTTPTGTLELPASTVERIEVVPDAASESPAPTSAVQPAELLRAAAIAQGLPPAFVQSVAKIESSLKAGAVSPKGAVGLMQLMPATAAELGVTPTDAQQNAAGGAKYLRTLLIRYNNDAALALAAYNAGPAAVAKYSGVPPYSETRNYILRVLREYAREQAASRAR